MASFGEDNTAATQREEGSSRNKYGGISPKKPLINKQGASNSTKGTTEPLKPKLQRTAYPQLPPRRPACTSGATE
uniref:Uncharacterized protein n=1 Tax=Oryza punctata TaxID=4537 RepID=A0A0E0JHL7_ORYPU